MSKETEKKMKSLSLKMEQVTRTHSVLNENQVQKIFNSTPRRYQYSRPAKGGGNWNYVRASYIRKALDSIFGFNWSFDIETSLEEAFNVAKLTNACVVKGVLTCRTKVDGQWVELKKVQFGRSEIKWQMEGTKENRKKKYDEFTGAPIPLDFGNDMKAASSDALKKCASLLGIAADVYDPDEFQEIKIIGSDSEKEAEREDNLQKKIKAAKKDLKTGSKEVKNEKTA